METGHSPRHSGLGHVRRPDRQATEFRTGAAGSATIWRKCKPSECGYYSRGTMFYISHTRG